MNRPDTRELIARALRENLSEAEKREWEKLLEADPMLRSSFAEEQALDRALERLPDMPLATNFTALAVQAALREEKSRRRSWKFFWSWPEARFGRAWAMFAGICAIGIAIGVSYHHSERVEVAQTVRSFTELASVIGSNRTRPEEFFQNFEAIQRLPAAGDGDVDMDLLVALQK